MKTYTVSWRRVGPRQFELLVNDIHVDTAMSEADAVRWVREWVPPEQERMVSDDQTRLPRSIRALELSVSPEAFASALGRKTDFRSPREPGIVARFLRESRGF